MLVSILNEDAKVSISFPVNSPTFVNIVFCIVASVIACAILEVAETIESCFTNVSTILSTIAGIKIAVGSFGLSVVFSDELLFSFVILLIILFVILLIPLSSISLFIVLFLFSSFSSVFIPDIIFTYCFRNPLIIPLYI